MSDIQALERLKKDRALQVEMRDRVIRLSNNPDFKALIEQEYMVNEVARFMEVAGDPRMKPDQRDDALREAYGPGCLKRWLQAREIMGDHAAEQIIQIDAELEELRQEGVEE